jgi:hypothetical protein
MIKSKHVSSLICLFWILLVSTSGLCQPAATPLPNAHAHNDYLHRHPLTDALKQGFTSVEADVFLRKNELYLGHIRPRRSKNRTLSRRYLEPLHRLLEQNGGKIYPGYEGVFYLMIDFKTEGDSTYAALKTQLKAFPLFQNNPHFQIFISGRRPKATILAETHPLAALDGIPSDLGKGISPAVMPVISDRFHAIFKWDGKDSMPENELKQLQDLANRAHAEGKKLRLWGIPDQANCWKILLAAGVDLINTDHLKKFAAFMRTQ